MWWVHTWFTGPCGISWCGEYTATYPHLFRWSMWANMTWRIHGHLPTPVSLVHVGYHDVEGTWPPTPHLVHWSMWVIMTWRVHGHLAVVWVLSHGCRSHYSSEHFRRIAPHTESNSLQLKLLTEDVIWCSLCLLVGVSLDATFHTFSSNDCLQWATS